MKTKEKLFLVWILVAVAMGLLFSHFCGGAVHAFEHFVASGLASPAHPGEISAGLFGTGVFSERN